MPGFEWLQKMLGSGDSYDEQAMRGAEVGQKMSPENGLAMIKRLVDRPKMMPRKWWDDVAIPDQPYPFKRPEVIGDPQLEEVYKSVRAVAPNAHAKTISSAPTPSVVQMVLDSHNKNGLNILRALEGNMNLRGESDRADDSIYINMKQSTPETLRATMGHELSHLNGAEEEPARMIGELMKRKFTQPPKK